MNTDKSLIISDRHERALTRTWQFRLLYATGLVLTMPAVCLARLWPGRARRDESVLAETNRAVLTALGFAFMA